MTYTLDHDWIYERERLSKLEKGFDPGTIRYFETLGVSAGWHCLEVGAGGGSIAEWLCQRVGRGGRVVATDLQTKFIEAINEPNLEVRRHNIATDDLEDGAFDLVHSRVVLEHLSSSADVLKRMVAALRPGGWLLSEALDFCSFVCVSDIGRERFSRSVAETLALMGSAGYDPEYGRQLRLDLRKQGLLDVEVEGRLYEMGGDRPLTGGWTLVLDRFRDELVKQGRLKREEVDDVISVMEGLDFCGLSPTIVAAWGRKPGN